MTTPWGAGDRMEVMDPNELFPPATLQGRAVVHALWIPERTLCGLVVDYAGAERAGRLVDPGKADDVTCRRCRRTLEAP